MIKKAKKSKQLSRYQKQLAILNDIRGLIGAADQQITINPMEYIATIEGLFKTFLEQSNYFVIKINNGLRVIKSPKDLVDLFYVKLKGTNTERLCSFGNSITESAEDILIMNDFVNNRMEALSCGRQAALQICGEIIEILIKYEHYFKFSNPIYSVKILRNNNIDWISRRAYEIKNNPLTYSIDSSFNSDVEKFEEEVLQNYGEEIMLGFEL